LKTKFGSRVHYGGNIRKSVLTILPRIRKDDLAVLELSSFQLQDLTHEKISPHVAVFTNLLCDHLNRHRDMREYAAAKSVIFRFQKPGDRLFYNGGDPAVKRLAVRASRRVGTRAAPRVPAALQTIVDKNLGAHYRVSVALAVAVARHFDVSEVAIARTLRAFHGLPARQEEIAARGGVHFVNDTTATIPDAAVAAIRRFRALAGPRHRVILIAGGQDKELDFRGMAREIKKSVDALILLPGTATDVLMAMSLIRTNKGHSSDVTTIQDKALPVNPHTFPRGIEPRGKDFSNTRSSPRQSRGAFWEGMGMKRASSMQEAVRTAYKIARRGDYVVLSPGAASFGLFLNEFDRGDQFVDAVRKLER